MARNSHLQALIIVCFSTLIFFACCLNLCCTAHHTGNATKGRMYLKGMFVFGTSVVDNGNNNYINDTLSKANYLPYGVDFPTGPTGRFSNGYNVADLIGRLLRLPLIPPFACPYTKGHGILHGVNYGSGGAGILDDTGSIAGGKISVNEQIKNFEEVTMPELEKLLRHKPAKILDRYLFLVAAGNNDFELNYFLQDNSTRPSLPVFVANLTSIYATQLQRLYEAGARKFALLTVYPIGCTPVVKDASNSQHCVKKVNAAAHYFNDQLIEMVDALKPKLANSNFVVVNTYKIITDIIKNPAARGFSNVTGPCCELKEIMGVAITCKGGGKVCRNRNSHVFFDGQHNTEAVNNVIAHKAFFSHSRKEAYPFNLQTLAQL